ncbi:hypothetical protein FNJ87_17615, partial [Nonlabens mediterrranea]|nr:hypothetical protein [Nonlabens mediterrranea]
MKVLFSLCFICILSAGCSSVKKAETAINTGNFDQAIDIAISNLSSDKNAKRKQEYVVLLEDAFAKAVHEDQIVLNRLQSDPNPAVLESIYETLRNMEVRQSKIRALLPLKVYDTGEEAVFPMIDYSGEIITARTSLSDHLLNNARKSLSQANTLQSRVIYDDLTYLNQINPNYKDTQQLLNEALEKGTDYVIVSLKNDTQLVIPERLEDELLNFSTYGLNDKWTLYHNRAVQNVIYDYGLDINFRNINISPEQILQKELQREKQVKDGFEYELDERGNVKKDSLGDDIKTDKYKLVKATILQNTQYKEVSIDANIIVTNLTSGQLIDRFPVGSAFIFNYIYGSVSGDRRAIDADYLQ